MYWDSVRGGDWSWQQQSSIKKIRAGGQAWKNSPQSKSNVHVATTTEDVLLGYLQGYNEAVHGDEGAMGCAPAGPAIQGSCDSSIEFVPRISFEHAPWVVLDQLDMSLEDDHLPPGESRSNARAGVLEVHTAQVLL